jgi:hypothetical protein
VQPEPTGSKPEEAAPREQYGLVTATSRETAPREGTPDAPMPESAVLSEALREEYGILSSMLASVWSASLFRVSLLLGVVSAIGVALGFAAQAGRGFGSTFTVFALVALPLALFLGLATFARTVELQRESYVYITGMNRIRHAIADAVPASRPYFVLSIYDDALGVYRSQGTGIRLRAPRFRLVFALSQTQGIVAVICAALAGIIGWIATAGFDSTVAWGVAAVAFVFVLAALLIYWNRSIAQLQAAIRPMFPTPPDAIDAPI